MRSLTFGVVFCHEGWRYPETVRWAARRGAQIVFHPNVAWAETGAFRPTSFADPAHTVHEKAILCRAAENSCGLASVHCASEGVPITSAVARPDGTLHAWQPYGEAGRLIADCDLSLATGLLAQRCRTGLERRRSGDPSSTGSQKLGDQRYDASRLLAMWYMSAAFDEF